MLSWAPPDRSRIRTRPPPSGAERSPKIGNTGMTPFCSCRQLMETSVANQPQPYLSCPPALWQSRHEREFAVRGRAYRTIAKGDQDGLRERRPAQHRHVRIEPPPPVGTFPVGAG